jgi:DNA polymerase V
MPRRSDIPSAFDRAIKFSPKGHQSITTEDFVTELAKLNWTFTLEGPTSGYGRMSGPSKTSPRTRAKPAFTLNTIRTEGAEMGFPSPAADYIESRIDLTKIFVINPGATRLLKTTEGYILVDAMKKVMPGHIIAFNFLGQDQVGKYVKGAIITSDGEAIEGEALDEVIVLGVVTVEIRSLVDEGGPTI